LNEGEANKVFIFIELNKKSLHAFEIALPSKFSSIRPWRFPERGSRGLLQIGRNAFEILTGG
jgi:hypothetical protein